MLIVCPICGRKYKVADKFRDKKTHCWHCHRDFVASEILPNQISGKDQIVNGNNRQSELLVAKWVVMPALLAKPVIVARSHVNAARQILEPFEEEFRNREGLWLAANDERNRLQRLERFQIRAIWVRQNKLWLILC